MLLFVGIAFINGMVNIINKMVNLQAKLKLGTASGTLINYLEATILSILIVIIMGNSQLINFSYLKTIPPIYFFGGLFGLFSMVFILIGMEKSQISYSTIIVLIGQLGAGLFIDFVMTQKIVPAKIFGILLVIAGVAIDKHLSRGTEKNIDASSDGST